MDPSFRWGDDLLKHLPIVRGRYRENADLSKSNWFGVGGSHAIRIPHSLPAQAHYCPEHLS